MLELAAVGVGYLIKSGVLTKALPKTVKPISKAVKRHFSQGSQDLHGALQDSLKNTINVLQFGVEPRGLDRFKASLSSKLNKEFQETFTQQYLQPFLEERQWSKDELVIFRRAFVSSCKRLKKQVAQLLPELDESQIADIIFPPESNPALHAEDPLEGKRNQAHHQFYSKLQELSLPQDIYQFLTYRDMLFYGVMFFFQEEAKTQPRVKAVLDIYQQQHIQLDMQTFQLDVTSTQQQLMQNQEELSRKLDMLLQQGATQTPQFQELQLLQTDLQADLSAFPERSQQAMGAIQGVQNYLAHLSHQFGAFGQQLNQISGQIEALDQKVEKGFERVTSQLDEEFQQVGDKLDALLGKSDEEKRSRFEMSVEVALEDGVVEYGEVKMLLNLAARSAIPAAEAKEIITEMVANQAGIVNWTQEEQDKWAAKRGQPGGGGGNKLALVAIVLVLALAGGVGFFIMNNQPPPPPKKAPEFKIANVEWPEGTSSTCKAALNACYKACVKPLLQKGDADATSTCRKMCWKKKDVPPFKQFCQ